MTLLISERNFITLISLVISDVRKAVGMDNLSGRFLKDGSQVLSKTIS